MAVKTPLPGDVPWPTIQTIVSNKTRAKSPSRKISNASKAISKSGKTSSAKINNVLANRARTVIAGRNKIKAEQAR